MASRASGAKAESSTRTSAPKTLWPEAIPSVLQSIDPKRARAILKRLRVLQQVFKDYQNEVEGLPTLITGVVAIGGESPGMALVLQAAMCCKVCRNFNLGAECQHCQHAKTTPEEPIKAVLAIAEAA